MRRFQFLLGCVLALAASTVSSAQDKSEALAVKAQQILQTYCYRCHGQNGSKEGGFNTVLEFATLAKDPEKLVPGSADKSRLFRRMGINKDMPPEDEKEQPSAADIGVIKAWIEAGAPAPAAAVEQNRPFLDLRHEISSMRDYLRKQPRDDRVYIRFFTLRHLHNMPINRLRDIDLRVYRAALSKLVNSLSWKPNIVIPATADSAQTLFAIDLRHLDWDRKNLWQEILRIYPYGLKHDRYPDDAELNDIASEVYTLTHTDVPLVRADWFIATASRPPLYHTLVQIPDDARVLEHTLKVNVADNFYRGQLARAGFNASGVSSSNRMVERHDANYGAYWKSYDFKTSAGSGNLFVFPLGPEFQGNQFARQAFKHDGGEIIFNLPNGLQAYMLIDGKDKRIDAGPIEVVSDGKKISGNPLVVNGLSCMSCHQHGMIRFKDQIRAGNILGGAARDKVRQIYPDSRVFDELVSRDEQRFLTALTQAMAPFVAQKGQAVDVKDFPEPVSHIARWYISQELTATETASELGLDDPRIFQGAVQANPRLQELGLFPLTNNGTIKREVWEFQEFITSPFQDAARELKLGTPVKYQ